VALTAPVVAGEGCHIIGAETNHPAHLVSGELAGVNEAIEMTQRDAKPLTGVTTAYPLFHFLTVFLGLIRM
jgi:hypothetical protein